VQFLEAGEFKNDFLSQPLREIALILITAGFWSIQGQLYASMPDYVLRMAGETYKPEWYANINPLVVVIFVVMITQMVRKWKPQNAILVAMCMIPLSAVAMASSAWFHGNVTILGLEMHPITFMMIIGISIQGVAECFLSPRYYEFASKQAPKGEEGLYMGYQFLNVAVAWLAAFIVSGHLLEIWCPAPEVVAAMPPELAAHAYDHAHYIWYVYAMIGVAAFVALLIFRHVTDRIDRKADQ
jgi:dipeptide/tripeptide permease